MGYHWAYGWYTRSGFLALAFSRGRLTNGSAWHPMFDVFAKLVRICLSSSLTTIKILTHTCISPATANTRYWLTPEEKELAIRRVPVASDDASFSKKQFVAVFKDYQNAFYTLIYISVLVSISSYSTFLPTIIRDMGVQSLQAQLLTIPPYIVACCCLFVCVDSFVVCMHV